MDIGSNEPIVDESEYVLGSTEPIVDDMTHEERDEVFRMPWEGEDGQVVHDAPHLDDPTEDWPEPTGSLVRYNPNDDKQLDFLDFGWLP